MGGGSQMEHQDAHSASKDDVTTSHSTAASTRPQGSLEPTIPAADAGTASDAETTRDLSAPRGSLSATGGSAEPPAPSSDPRRVRSPSVEVNVRRHKRGRSASAAPALPRKERVRYAPRKRSASESPDKRSQESAFVQRTTTDVTASVRQSARSSPDLCATDYSERSPAELQDEGCSNENRGRPSHKSIPTVEKAAFTAAGADGSHDASSIADDVSANDASSDADADACCDHDLQEIQHDPDLSRGSPAMLAAASCMDVSPLAAAYPEVTSSRSAASPRETIHNASSATALLPAASTGGGRPVPALLPLADALAGMSGLDCRTGLMEPRAYWEAGLRDNHAYEEVETGTPRLPSAVWTSPTTDQTHIHEVDVWRPGPSELLCDEVYQDHSLLRPIHPLLEDAASDGQARRKRSYFKLDVCGTHESWTETDDPRIPARPMAPASDVSRTNEVTTGSPKRKNSSGDNGVKQGAFNRKRTRNKRRVTSTTSGNTEGDDAILTRRHVTGSGVRSGHVQSNTGARPEKVQGDVENAGPSGVPEHRALNRVIIHVPAAEGSVVVSRRLYSDASDDIASNHPASNTSHPCGAGPEKRDASAVSEEPLNSGSRFLRLPQNETRGHNGEPSNTSSFKNPGAARSRRVPRRRRARRLYRSWTSTTSSSASDNDVSVSPTRRRRRQRQSARAGNQRALQEAPAADHRAAPAEDQRAAPAEDPEQWDNPDQWQPLVLFREPEEWDPPELVREPHVSPTPPSDSPVLSSGASWWSRSESDSYSTTTESESSDWGSAPESPVVPLQSGSVPEIPALPPPALRVSTRGTPQQRLLESSHPQPETTHSGGSTPSTVACSGGEMVPRKITLEPPGKRLLEGRSDALHERFSDWSPEVVMVTCGKKVHEIELDAGGHDTAVLCGGDHFSEDNRGRQHSGTCKGNERLRPSAICSKASSGQSYGVEPPMLSRRSRTSGSPPQPSVRTSAKTGANKPASAGADGKANGSTSASTSASTNASTNGNGTANGTSASASASASGRRQRADGTGSTRRSPVKCSRCLSGFQSTAELQTHRCKRTSGDNELRLFLPRRVEYIVMTLHAHFTPSRGHHEASADGSAEDGRTHREDSARARSDHDVGLDQHDYRAADAQTDRLSETSDASERSERSEMSDRTAVCETDFSEDFCCYCGATGDKECDESIDHDQGIGEDETGSATGSQPASENGDNNASSDDGEQVSSATGEGVGACGGALGGASGDDRGAFGEVREVVKLNPTPGAPVWRSLSSQESRESTPGEFERAPGGGNRRAVPGRERGPVHGAAALGPLLDRLYLTERTSHGHELEPSAGAAGGQPARNSGLHTRPDVQQQTQAIYLHSLSVDYFRELNDPSYPVSLPPEFHSPSDGATANPTPLAPEHASEHRQRPPTGLDSGCDSLSLEGLSTVSGGAEGAVGGAPLSQYSRRGNSSAPNLLEVGSEWDLRGQIYPQDIPARGRPASAIPAAASDPPAPVATASAPVAVTTRRTAHSRYQEEAYAAAPPQMRDFFERLSLDSEDEDADEKPSVQGAEAAPTPEPKPLEVAVSLDEDPQKEQKPQHSPWSKKGQGTSRPSVGPDPTRPGPNLSRPGPNPGLSRPGPNPNPSRPGPNPDPSRSGPEEQLYPPSRFTDLLFRCVSRGAVNYDTATRAGLTYASCFPAYAAQNRGPPSYPPRPPMPPGPCRHAPGPCPYVPVPCPHVPGPRAQVPAAQQNASAYWPQEPADRIQSPYDPPHTRRDRSQARDDRPQARDDRPQARDDRPRVPDYWQQAVAERPQLLTERQQVPVTQPQVPATRPQVPAVPPRWHEANMATTQQRLPTTPPRWHEAKEFVPRSARTSTSATDQQQHVASSESATGSESATASQRQRADTVHMSAEPNSQQQQTGDSQPLRQGVYYQRVYYATGELAAVDQRPRNDRRNAERQVALPSLCNLLTTNGDRVSSESFPDPRRRTDMDAAGANAMNTQRYGQAPTSHGGTAMAEYQLPPYDITALTASRSYQTETASGGGAGGLQSYSSSHSTQNYGMDQQASGLGQQTSGLGQQTSGLVQQTSGLRQQISALGREPNGVYQSTTGLSGTSMINMIDPTRHLQEIYVPRDPWDSDNYSTQTLDQTRQERYSHLHSSVPPPAMGNIRAETSGIETTYYPQQGQHVLQPAPGQQHGQQPQHCQVLHPQEGATREGNYSMAAPQATRSTLATQLQASEQSYLPSQQMSQQSYMSSLQPSQQPYTPSQQMSQQSYTPSQQMSQQSYMPSQQMSQQSYTPAQQTSQQGYMSAAGGAIPRHPRQVAPYPDQLIAQQDAHRPVESMLPQQSQNMSQQQSQNMPQQREMVYQQGPMEIPQRAPNVQQQAPNVPQQTYTLHNRYAEHAASAHGLAPQQSQPSVQRMNGMGNPGFPMQPPQPVLQQAQFYVAPVIQQYGVHQQALNASPQALGVLPVIGILPPVQIQNTGGSRHAIQNHTATNAYSEDVTNTGAQRGARDAGPATGGGHYAGANGGDVNETTAAQRAAAPAVSDGRAAPSVSNGRAAPSVSDQCQCQKCQHQRQITEPWSQQPPGH